MASPHTRARIITRLAVAIWTVCGLAGPLPAQSADSPTAVFLRYWEAAKNMDPQGMKKALSQEDLKVLAKAPMPLDRVLESMARQVPASKPPTRAEKIDGNRASLEYRTVNGETKQEVWEVVHFVKEHGEWKITVGKGRREE